ncbi:MAG: tetratricopeptide repeat protein [Acidimicrobiia bacterium]
MSEFTDDHDDWQAHYGISDDLADEMGEYQSLAHHALEYGPTREAVRCFAWLVEQWARVAGIRDEQTMIHRAFLARAFAADGQVRMAADELQRLAEDRAAVFGPDDPQTLRTRGQLGQVLARGGFPEEGIAVQLPLLDDRLRLFGPDAPGVFDTMGNLAEAYLLAGRAIEGRDLYADLLERRTRVLGVQHEDTVRTRLNLVAANAKTSTSPAKAVWDLKVAIDHFTETVGPLHDATLTARGHLADATLRTGDLETTMELLEDLIEDRLMVLGPDHPDTKRSQQKLADVERWWNEDADAAGDDGEATE